MQQEKNKTPWFMFLIEHREVPLLAILVLFVLVCSVRVPGYIPNNWQNVLTNGSIVLVMACGMLMVLLIGSIDISVGAVLAVSGCIAGKLMSVGAVQSTLLMYVIGTLIGAGFGLIIGVLTSYGRILPIIVSLGVQYIARALIPMDWLLGMEKINPTQLTDGFKKLMLGVKLLSLPLLVWVAVIVAVLVGLFLKYTRTGRSLYAVGSNREAAEVRGVHTNRIIVLAHTLCGALAGLSGILWLGFYNAIEKGSGTGIEMFVIASCVLGGVSVSGGYGKITGVCIGAVMIATINNAIPQLFPGNSMLTEFFKGILMLAAILLNVILRRIADKQELERRSI